jgi:uncharacterized membrane protein YphA (DoxX/SURF4 family)
MPDEPATEVRPKSKMMVWSGRVLTGLAALSLLFSGGMKLAKPAAIVEEFARLGYPESLIPAIGILELLCTIFYLIPRTTVLGAILLTGYLGGATATHVRIEDPFFPPVIVGVLVWLGIFLRDQRLRTLLPLRR